MESDIAYIQGAAEDPSYGFAVAQPVFAASEFDRSFDYFIYFAAARLALVCADFIPPKTAGFVRPIDRVQLGGEGLELRSRDLLPVVVAALLINAVESFDRPLTKDAADETVALFAVEIGVIDQPVRRRAVFAGEDPDRKETNNEGKQIAHTCLPSERRTEKWPPHSLRIQWPIELSKPGFIA